VKFNWPRSLGITKSGTIFARQRFQAFSTRKGHAVDKTVIGLLGAASALALAGGGPASAAVPTASEASGLKPAQSFAELLDPIPNAAGLLQAQDEQTGGAESKPVQLAQYHHHHHHYRHHHHHHHYRHYHHHHHHYM
jgi:hypothetical protein